MRVHAYAAPAAAEPLTPTVIERRDVGPNDVLIDIKYAGIVAEVGAEVTGHQVGDRVGVGCMVNSCRECVNCQNGDE